MPGVADPWPEGVPEEPKVKVRVEALRAAAQRHPGDAELAALVVAAEDQMRAYQDERAWVAKRDGVVVRVTLAGAVGLVAILEGARFVHMAGSTGKAGIAGVVAGALLFGGALVAYLRWTRKNPEPTPTRGRVE